MGDNVRPSDKDSPDYDPVSSPPATHVAHPTTSGAPATPPLVAPARSLGDGGGGPADLEPEADSNPDTFDEGSDYADADSSWGGSPESSMMSFYSPR